MASNFWSGLYIGLLVNGIVQDKKKEGKVILGSRMCRCTRKIYVGPIYLCSSRNTKGEAIYREHGRHRVCEELRAVAVVGRLIHSVYSVVRYLTSFWSFLLQGRV